MIMMIAVMMEMMIKNMFKIKVIILSLFLVFSSATILFSTSNEILELVSKDRQEAIDYMESMDFLTQEDIQEHIDAYDWLVENADETYILEQIPSYTFGYLGIKKSYIENIEAREWLNENVENQEFLNDILNETPEEYRTNYPWIKILYEDRVESYEWLKENTDFESVMEEHENEFGKDYAGIKERYQEEETSGKLNSFLILAMFLIFPVWNSFFFLPFLRDMKKREENLKKWIFLIILAGPIGLTLYLSFRKPKDNEIRQGSKIYHLSKNIIIPWAIYGVITPIFLIIAISITDLIGMPNANAFEFIGEGLFWFLLLHIFTIVPLIVILPTIIFLIIMFLSKPKKQSVN